MFSIRDENEYKLKNSLFHIHLRYNRNILKQKQKSACKTDCGRISAFLLRQKSWCNAENRRLWQTYVQAHTGTRKHGIGNGSEREQRTENSERIASRER